MSAKDGNFYRNLRKNYPTVDHAEGVYLWDTEGNRYLDGSGGACVVSIGHGVKEIREAMLKQAERVSFAHGSHFTSEAAIDYARQLVGMMPSPTLNKCYFLSEGSTAVETAIKLARQYWREAGQPDKFKIISRWTSFHGNTTGALALGGHTARRRHYQPLMLHTPHIEPAYCYRCPFSRTPETCDLECADALERTIKYEGPDSVAAFIAEPVVGATAGALVPKDGYWQRIRAICDAYEILLIADEVMTGMGRCGTPSALQNWNVVPDILVMAKGLSSGYIPLGAVIVHEWIWQTIRDGSGAFVHGHTYSMNPLVMAVGRAVLEYLNQHDLLRRSREMGTYLNAQLATLRDLPIVGDTRGLGMFCGVEFVEKKDTRQPFDPSQKVHARVADAAFQRGLITYPGSGGADGISGDHLLICPPFIITHDQIDTLVATVREAIEAVAQELNSC
ncbi:aspartate aminotransferase family protein [candidate division KSB3 bacterium]|uniref:Aspartate aminotransferase family protein n=1 Tax=candidate division KSB3 bacterium TaxID=2044937 RepID=A0A9D5JUP9_9BACT|nr:aspartate aminotransferase family protein [candidate division KSB3 bacterium]MBD3324483.1 aspartate aminotransferase family protein [candidate division KSB3 bacterium]